MNRELVALVRELRAAADPQRARVSAWFFKTGEGQYGEGDRFIGIRVPVQRQIAKRHAGISLDAMAQLIASPIHEHRVVTLEILVSKYKKGNERERQAIFDFYRKQRKWINNWDLVDGSAPPILGTHLVSGGRELLDRMSVSKNLWERRMAIVATLTFIRRDEFDDTLRIAEKLLADKHDLIHKAMGWMLREVGKRSERALVQFLEVHYKAMPRTALRYAIERFPEERRKRMLRGDFSTKLARVAKKV
jgi:3-methyladenine DNA glycosylase AlkD